MKDYGLSFISNEALFNHVKDNIDNYNYLDTFNFHKNIVQYIGNNWQLTDNCTYDVINKDLNIFITFENETIRHSSNHLQKVFIKMQHSLLQNKEAQCYYVGKSIKHNQNIPWKLAIDNQVIFHDNIRHISIDQYYQLITNTPISFSRLSVAIPQILNNIACKHDGLTH